MAPTLLMDSLDQLAAVPRQPAIANRQHLRERRRLERREPARHRLESHAGAPRRPPARARPNSRHRRRRDPADGFDPARRSRDRRRFRRLRLGRHQRCHELHSRHRVRGRQGKPANRHDGPARPPALSSRVRGGIGDRRARPRHRLRRLLRRRRRVGLRRPRLGRRRLGAVHAAEPDRATAAFLCAGWALARHHLGRPDPRPHRSLPPRSATRSSSTATPCRSARARRSSALRRSAAAGPI